MAGYIGSKSSVTQVDGYNRTEADAEFVNDPNSVITVSGSNVGIGTSSPSNALHVNSGASNTAALFESTDAISIVSHKDNSTTNLIASGANGNNYVFYNGSERMRIDSSGNLLVGKTSVGVSSVGAEFRDGVSDYSVTGVSSSSAAALFGRNTNDGDILRFRKDNVAVGSIGSRNAGGVGVLYMEFNGSSSAVGFTGTATASHAILPCENGLSADNIVDLGVTSVRFDDIYATNGTIQTSDRNEKQDIEVLSDAETRVAQACKGLLRKFRWQDAVAEKGDDARIHFGIIAQDLQDAFAAEGLDAGRYAMFISSTWWEATETYTDDDGVEQTRTDTYETQAEAPEGATERTRLGVRYPELLAFIIGAM